MARGKAKLRKGQRMAEKNLSACPVPSSFCDDNTTKDEGLVHELAADPCDHRDLDPEKMMKVSGLLSELFITSFRLAVPSLFRGMIQNLQDHILKEKVLGFLDAGFKPSLIKSLAKDWSTREGITVQIRTACEEELADVILRLSTEDCFDLACDLAVRHGRDLKIYGPPCACSFSHCLGCLEKLVTNVCETPPLPAPPIRPIDRQDLVQTLMDVLQDEQAGSCDAWQLGHVKDQSWIIDIGDAWQNMADVLWETAIKIDPMKLTHVQQALETLRKLNGLDLWYTVVMRELETASAGFPPQTNGGRENKALVSSLSAEFERMRKERGKQRKTNEEEVDDIFGQEVRKALARAIREQGNAAYAKNRYQEAAEHYTKAMVYDAEEAIYPLNRAACMVKLSKFEEAEADCTTAMELDCKNHKAWFRRGVSRAGMGNVLLAMGDFTEVLHLQKKDPKGFAELRKMAIEFLHQAARKRNGSDKILARIDAILPTYERVTRGHYARVAQVGLGPPTFEQMMQHNETLEESDHSETDSYTSISPEFTVNEVFHQVSFALAFSKILKQRTGVDIKVPVASGEMLALSSKTAAKSLR